MQWFRYNEPSGINDLCSVSSVSPYLEYYLLFWVSHFQGVYLIWRWGDCVYWFNLCSDFLKQCSAVTISTAKSNQLRRWQSLEAEVWFTACIAFLDISVDILSVLRLIELSIDLHSTMNLQCRWNINNPYLCENSFYLQHNNRSQSKVLFDRQFDSCAAHLLGATSVSSPPWLVICGLWISVRPCACTWSCGVKKECCHKISSSCGFNLAANYAGLQANMLSKLAWTLWQMYQLLSCPG